MEDTSTLLTIAPEIRSMIYKALFRTLRPISICQGPMRHGKHGLSVLHSETPKILQACRKIYEEASPAYRNALTIDLLAFSAWALPSSAIKSAFSRICLSDVKLINIRFKDWVDLTVFVAFPKLVEVHLVESQSLVAPKSVMISAVRREEFLWLQLESALKFLWIKNFIEGFEGVVVTGTIILRSVTRESQDKMWELGAFLSTTEKFSLAVEFSQRKVISSQKIFEAH